jgi:hypothetical protein
MNNNGNNAQKFSDSQRKALVQELKENYNTLRCRAREKYEKARNSLLQSLIRGEAEKKGFLPLIDEILACRTKIQDSEHALAKYGIEVDTDDELGFVSGETAPFRRTLEKRADKELGTLDALLAKFDSAAVKIWTVSSAETAEKLISELL